MNSHFAKATRDTYELKIMNIRASLYLILHSFLPLLFTKKYCSIETFLLNKKRSGVIPQPQFYTINICLNNKILSCRQFTLTII